MGREMWLDPGLLHAHRKLPFGQPGRGKAAHQASSQSIIPLTSREQFCFPFTGPGISSYSSNPLAAGTSLEHCLNQALRDVPKEKHTGTPLYLGATAGMRLLK